MIAAIVAVDINWGIGYNGQLLESIPNDLKHFKELTTEKVVVMGRKTWDSLPKKPLPNRTNIVISNQGNCILDSLTVRASLQDIEETLNDFENDVFIIGGGTIYEKLLPFCDRVYLTKIYKSHENVDTYFPNLDISSEWVPASCSAVYKHGNLQYQFWEYDRVN